MIRVVAIFVGAASVGALLLLCLASDTVTHSVRSAEDGVHVRVFDQTFDLPAIAASESLSVCLSSEARYSTPQLIVADRGLLLSGWSILKLLVSRKAGTCAPRVPARGQHDYLHFNPFRTMLVLSSGTGELAQFSVNLPDSWAEHWKRTGVVTILRHEEVHPPWLRLTFVGLLSSFYLAAVIAFPVLRWAAPASAISRSESGSTSARWAVPAVFAAGTLLVGFVFTAVFHRMPAFGDEMNYLMQGKIFASLRLSVPEPRLPEFFRVEWMHMFGDDGKIWGFHPPGNAALLALGWLVGLSWLTVPVVGGLNLAVQWMLAREIFGGWRAPLVHVVVLGTSHYFLSLSASYMAHAPSFLFLSLFTLFCLRFWRTGESRELLWAGIALGVAFTMRPLSAALAAIVPAVVLLPRMRRKDIGWVLAGGLATGAIAFTVFAYTHAITGRWAFPYSIKGQEVGLGIAERLSKGWNYRLANLFRNLNEFQTRIHSFGFIVNAIPFFLGLILPTGRVRRILVTAAISFASFTVLHSFLHWYGWKWEPRMLFDVSFLFFLVTTGGLITLYESISWRWLRAGSLVLGTAALGWVVLRDLPARASSEYASYNGSPYGVRDLIAERRITRAIVFFARDEELAAYQPYNTLRFDGDILYAKDRGSIENHRLMEAFPDREVFFSPRGMTLESRPNFYRRDLGALRADLTRIQGYRIVVVVPWLPRVATRALDVLPGERIDPSRLLALLSAPESTTDPKLLVVLVDDSVELSSLLDARFATRTLEPRRYETPIRLVVLEGPRPGGDTVPGFRLECFEGTKWTGSPYRRLLVSSIDAGPCPGERRSLLWRGRFDLPAERKMKLFLVSDDGSALLVDGKVVVDNRVNEEHGFEERQGEVQLAAGLHELEIRYFNGPTEGRIQCGFVDEEGVRRDLTVSGFESGAYFFVPGETR